jgi:uncharacterized protein YchJ
VQGQLPPDALHLMRSRYTAFVLENEAYLKQTWQAAFRPDSVEFDVGAKWLGLDVKDFVAIPPRGVEWLEQRYGAMARDFHVGWFTEESRTVDAMQKKRIWIGRHIDRMGKGPRGFNMSTILIPRFLHARKLAYQANPGGRVWGTDVDMPPEVEA